MGRGSFLHYALKDKQQTKPANSGVIGWLDTSLALGFLCIKLVVHFFRRPLKCYKSVTFISKKIDKMFCQKYLSTMFVSDVCQLFVGDSFFPLTSVQHNFPINKCESGAT